MSSSAIARRSSAGDEPETIPSATFGPDAVHGQQLGEELALGGVGEAVQLQRVLAHVEVGLDDDLLLLAGVGGLAERGRGGRDEITDAAHLDHEPVGGAPDRPPSQPRDHALSSAIRRSGGASAWQIATASASEAWFGVGFVSSARIARTIRCTCAFSARP